MWLNKLKIAIIEKNTDNINKLLDEMPTFSDAKEIEQAAYLLKEASELIQSRKDETLSSMTQIKKTMEFLHSAKEQSPGKLDIKL